MHLHYWNSERPAGAEPAAKGRLAGSPLHDRIDPRRRAQSRSKLLHKASSRAFCPTPVKMSFAATPLARKRGETKSKLSSTARGTRETGKRLRSPLHLMEHQQASAYDWKCFCRRERDGLDGRDYAAEQNAWQAQRTQNSKFFAGAVAARINAIEKCLETSSDFAGAQ